MIIYNEKAEEDDQQQLSVLDPTAKTSPAAPPLPNHASPISSVDSRLGAGLLHQYLQIYKDQLDQGRVQMPVPHRQNSDETAVDVEATGVPLDEPPPYTSEDALLSKCHALPKSPIQSPRSPSPPYQPVAGPSNSNHHHSTTPRTGDIDATWTFDDSDLDEDSTMIGPELDPEDAASAVSACGCKSFETLRGDITLHLKIPNRHSRKRRKVQIITHCGSIDVTLSHPAVPNPSTPIPMHLHAHSRSKGNITIKVPLSFTGVLRIIHPYPRPPTLTTIEPPLDPVTLIFRSPSETCFFIGDLHSAGYIKGMDWTGNLLEVRAEDGSVTVGATDQVKVEEEIREAESWGRIALTALRTLFTVPPIWSLPL